ncbi:secreted frizzled-related protein 3 [Pundamilia nyererei]|uniref:Secreted frizzled-related protein 3 n=1 Tax=Pundamilia nyererei TaxID=303518 RepID=A0A9Y3RSS2_9CICH|nr:PREDICTED: secreted frizzled-related protein 3 [Pundamilia nyererei]
MLSLGLAVSLLAVSCALWPAAVRAASCETVRIPLCRSMPWNMTKMPNHLHHSTQDNAVLAIEQFEGLLGTGCSPDLLFFLCAMYAPICTIDFQHEPIKPCKAVCERAKLGCEPVMKRYNHSWPDNLACSELPLYDRGVCISPEAIVKADGPDPYHQDPARCNPDRCRCKSVRMNMRTYEKNNYNYVIRARVKDVRNRGLEPTAVVDVKEVIKSSLVNIPKMTLTLYYSSSCLCPKLTPGEDYIIMGYEDGETSKLLLIDRSIAQKWKDRIGRKVKRWNQMLHRRIQSRH